MAQVQPAVDAFILDIKRLENNFNGNLEVLVSNLSKASDTELINTMSQLNLFNELIEQGYGEALDKLDGEYGKLLESALKEAERRGVTALDGPGLQGLEVLKDLNTEQLINQAGRYADTMKAQLFQNLYAGLPPSEIMLELAGTELATHQLAVATYTGIKNFDEMARFKVFEGLDVKWTYFGPLDERTRETCRATILNEPEGGYTEKQIKSSKVKTKFGTRGGFNCRHSWEVR